MRFMLLIHNNPDAFAALSEAERDALMNDHVPFQQDLTDNGIGWSTHALDEPSASSVVRIRDGVAAVTDGPFTEAKEHFAGYYLIECEGPERALEIAAKMPEARFLGVEVRPVVYSTGA
jgi:hypothetical protein